MRKSSREKHQAIAQFVGLSLLAAVLAGVTAWDLRQPADATQLALPISELHSQSAELAAIQDERSAHPLDERFLRAHLQQLSKDQRASAEELAQLEPANGLADTQRAALADAAELGRRLDQATTGAILDERDIDALRDRFRGRERDLRN